MTNKISNLIVFSSLLALVFFISILGTTFVVIGLTDISLFSIIFLAFAYLLFQQLRKIIHLFNYPEAKILNESKKFIILRKREVIITFSLSILTVVLAYYNVESLSIVKFILSLPLFVLSSFLFKIDIFFRYTLVRELSIVTSLFTIFVEIYFLYFIAKIISGIIKRFE